MEAYIVHLAKGIRIFGQGYALKPYCLFFLLLHSFEAIVPSSFAHEVVLVKFELQTHMEHLSLGQSGFLVVCASQLPSLLLKIEGGGQNSFSPLFGIKFKKKQLFYFSMEAYIVHLAKGIRIFGQGYALKP
jgi:hypothetical protein